MYIMQPYDDSLSYILNCGTRKKNRTGEDTLAVFGMQARYQLEKFFPILTRRKVWPRSIFAELLWVISGSTNNKDLEALGSKIWRPWVDEAFEREHSFIKGSLGPVYGFQLRYFGGQYNAGIHSVGYGHGGFDQLQYMIDEINKNPNSRRILFSLWNPKDINKMKLPPCHYTFQIFIDSDRKRMSGMLTQRSADYPIGVPANIQFYSALIHMIAQQTGYTPHEFVHTTGDSHIYLNQFEKVKEYLARDKPDSPKFKLHKAKDIFSYKMEDFELLDYLPESPISIPVAV